jgi:UDP-glucuronate decarboxylase
MHILITGGAGFIGTNLSLFLLAQGHQVTGIDNLLTGQSRNVDMLQTKGGANYHFRQLDIISEEFAELEIGHVDWIINLACPASPPRYQADPLHTIATCTTGMTNVLELAKRLEAKVLQASTSEVYGDPLVHPQTESYRGNVNTIGIRSCYDEGKRMAETICFEYARLFGLDVRLIRIFNTYGPYMDPEDGRVVTNFINQALHKQSLTIYGAGQQTRSFQYVDDLIAGIWKYMQVEEALFGPINLGNPDEFTIKQLLDLVVEQTETESEIVFMPLPADDPLQRKPDISFAKAKLNWEPKIKLADGLSKTIAYFREIL